MRIGIPAGGRANFADRNPSIIALETDGTFIVDGSLVGVDYTAPAGRAALIEQVHVIIELNGDIGGTGEILLQNGYTPDGGAPVVNTFGQLPSLMSKGVYHFHDMSKGRMLPGDRWSTSMFRVVTTPSGRLITQMKGLEFDV